MCKKCFIALLLRVPCTHVLQTTASVMPERSTPPNLALKRSAKSHFSQLLYIYARKTQHFVINPALKRNAKTPVSQL